MQGESIMSKEYADYISKLTEVEFYREWEKICNPFRKIAKEIKERNKNK